MPKDKDGTVEHEIESPFVGGEEDDLMDMEYVANDETETLVETMPPETAEEAELRKIGEPTNEELLAQDEATKDAEDLAKTPPEDETPPKDEDETPPKGEGEEDEGPMVPLSRFEEVNKRMKASEAEIAALKAKAEEPAPEPESEPYDYAAKEGEAMEALLEGDQTKYAELRAEIRAAEKEETLREAREIAETTNTNSREDMSFEETGASIEAAFPEFSTTSESYNEDARNEMLDLYVGYARSGNYSRAEALQKAADQTARIYRFDAESKETPPDNVVPIKDKKADVKAKVDASNNQPPPMEAKAPGSGDEPKLDVLNMPDEEFESLPESTKRRLRGDIV